MSYPPPSGQWPQSGGGPDWSSGGSWQSNQPSQGAWQPFDSTPAPGGGQAPFDPFGAPAVPLGQYAAPASGFAGAATAGVSKNLIIWGAVGFAAVAAVGGTIAVISSSSGNGATALECPADNSAEEEVCDVYRQAMAAVLDGDYDRNLEIACETDLRKAQATPESEELARAMYEMATIVFNAGSAAPRATSVTISGDTATMDVEIETDPDLASALAEQQEESLKDLDPAEAAEIRAANAEAWETMTHVQQYFVREGGVWKGCNQLPD